MQFRLKRIIKKSLFNKNRYYSDNYYHQRFLGIYDNIAGLRKLFSCDGKDIIETQTPIILNNKVEFGSNLRYVKKSLNSPFVIIKRNLDHLNFNILLLKVRLGGFKCKQNIHLFENSLYYYNYVFSYLTKSEKEIIKKLLCKKYLQEHHDLTNKVIVDKNGNKLFLNENVDFSINYLTGNPLILKELTDFQEINRLNHQKLIEQNEVELLNKL